MRHRTDKKVRQIQREKENVTDLDTHTEKMLFLLPFPFSVSLSHYPSYTLLLLPSISHLFLISPFLSLPLSLLSFSITLLFTHSSFLALVESPFSLFFPHSIQYRHTHTLSLHQFFLSTLPRPLHRPSTLSTCPPPPHLPSTPVRCPAAGVAGIQVIK